MNTRHILSLGALAISLTIQLPQAVAQIRIDWVRLYRPGIADDCELWDIYRLADQDYLMCGEASIARRLKYWLIRTGAQGDTLWARFYGGERTDAAAYACIETDEGGLVVGGQADIEQDDIVQFSVLRTDEDGSQIWWRTYAPDLPDEHQFGSCKAVIELKSGELLCAGYVSTRPNGGGDLDGYVVKMDADGNPIWARQYGVANRLESLYALREVEEGYAAAGRNGEQGGQDNLGAFDYWLLKVDENGNIVWSRMFGGERNERLTSMVTTSNGGFFLAGYTGSAVRNDDIYLVRTDGEGRLDWERDIDLGGDEVDIGGGHFMRRESAQCAARLSDGGFAVVGSVGLVRDNVWRYYSACFAVDAGGNEVWRRFDRRLFEEAEHTWYRAVIEGPDHSVLAVGKAYLNNGPRGVMVKIIVLPPRPQIISFVPEMREFSVLIADSVWFAVSAEDLQDDSLRYRWTQNDEVVSSDTSVWLGFPALGETRVACLVSDGVLADSVDWLVHVRDLFISRFTPDSLELALRRGSSVDFGIEIAAVAGDPVNYQWTLDNPDNPQPEVISRDSLVTMEFLRSGNYALEAIAGRGESFDVVTWTISVRSAIWSFWPDELSLTVPPDTLINFGVNPFNPESDSLSYAWYFGEDLLGMDSTIDVQFGGEERVQVTAIVADGAEVDTLLWDILVQPPDAVESNFLFPLSSFTLSASPNPFNANTTVSYDLPAAAEIRLTLHDIGGRRARVLADGLRLAGRHSALLDGSGLPAGVYLIRLEAGSNVRMMKAVVVK